MIRAAAGVTLLLAACACPTVPAEGEGEGEVFAGTVTICAERYECDDGYGAGIIHRRRCVIGEQPAGACDDAFACSERSSTTIPTCTVECEGEGEGCDEDAPPALRPFACHTIGRLCSDADGLFGVAAADATVEATTLEEAIGIVCAGSPCFDGDPNLECCSAGVQMVDCSAICLD